MFLACDGYIAPNDPALQPPLVNFELRLEEFLAWLNIFPEDRVPAPWITFPPTVTHWPDPRLPEISGWAVNAQDRSSLNPSGEPPTVTVVQLASRDDGRVLRVLGTASVGEDRNWKIEDVPVDLPVMHVAGTVAVGTTTSGYSNIVSVYRDQEALRPQIVSPKDRETIALWPLAGGEVSGTGPAGEEIKLLRNGEQVGRARVHSDGKWVVNDVSLREGENELVALIEVINIQSRPITVSFDPPWWPFKCERKHTTGFSHSHPGIDIPAGEGTPVYALAHGRVIRKSWDHFVRQEDGTCRVDLKLPGAYYVIVDHGSWFSLYWHLREDGRPSSGEVNRGSRIGYADTTGCASGSHLHLEVRFKPKDWIDNPPDLQKVNIRTLTAVNIEPSQFYWRYRPCEDGGS